MGRVIMLGDMEWDLWIEQVESASGVRDTCYYRPSDCRETRLDEVAAYTELWRQQR